jgi:hypothetical protein
MCFVHFFVAQVGLLQEWDDGFKEHERWSSSSKFIRGLIVGNIPIGSSDRPTASSEQPTRSRHVWVSFRV